MDCVSFIAIYGKLCSSAGRFIKRYLFGLTDALLKNLSRAMIIYIPIGICLHYTRVSHFLVIVFSNLLFFDCDSDSIEKYILIVSEIHLENRTITIVVAGSIHQRNGKCKASCLKADDIERYRKYDIHQNSGLTSPLYLSSSHCDLFPFPSGFK